ncbi:PDDEXK nuclease domain-containing protein [Myroides sp. LJL119]
MIKKVYGLFLKKEKQPSDIKEIIKDPMYVKFLALKTEGLYYQRDWEYAIIKYLQEFLLELGKGFFFVIRQKKTNLNGDEFFVNLVFFNPLLQYFVIIEIKTIKLQQQHIGAVINVCELL